MCLIVQRPFFVFRKQRLLTVYKIYDLHPLRDEFISPFIAAEVKFGQRFLPTDERHRYDITVSPPTRHAINRRFLKRLFFWYEYLSWGVFHVFASLEEAKLVADRLHTRRNYVPVVVAYTIPADSIVACGSFDGQNRCYGLSYLDMPTKEEFKKQIVYSAGSWAAPMGA